MDNYREYRYFQMYKQNKQATHKFVQYYKSYYLVKI